MKDYPAFEAALSFLPALPPGDVAALLSERAQALEVEMARAHASREFVEKAGLPRLFWIEDEFRNLLRETELTYVRRLIADIESGSLDGLDWWRAVHETTEAPEWIPALLGDGRPESENT